MKKLENGVLLFLILVIVLSSGSSYLALKQTPISKNSTDNHKMTIAMVNEDQGARFNGKPYQFGNEFVKNIEKDNNHDWYVVSRSVAENGLKRNVYNMMIVIPNDFSQKALSINSNVPEPVVLNYKINASENNNMKAKAEETASSILGDMNRRVIDVYFASVLGNLQDAQDNVGTLVKKEQAYAYVYNNDVHNPLAGYTSRFGAVQDNTKVSRESFKGLQSILKGFETNLGDGVKTNQSYQSSFTAFAKLQGTDGLGLKDFSNQLMNFDQAMNSGDVMQQLEQLQSVNKTINDLFQQNANSTNMLTESASLEKYLSDAMGKMTEQNSNLANTLSSDLQASVAEKLKKEIQTTSGAEHGVYLNQMFAKPNENAQKNIQQQIDKLPSLNPEDLDGLGLNSDTLTQLKNVIAVTKAYNSEFGYTPNHSSNSIPLSDLPDKIKNDLQETGITVTDSVTLPKDKKNGQVLTLSLPDEFNVSEVLLTLPNSEEMDYSKPFIDKNKIVLPANDEGKFTVKLKMNLKDANSTTIDVFQPIKWEWNLEQKDITAADTPAAPPTGSPASASSGKTTSQTASGINLKIGVGMNQQTGNASTGSTDGHQQLAEPITQQNNLIFHQLMSPLTSNSKNDLINAANETVTDYQKLLMMYNIYFGIGMDQFSSPDLADRLTQHNLSDLASEDSLYYLFNKQDIVDLLANYVAGQITEEVRGETEDLKGKINDYINLVTGAQTNSKNMANMIAQTTAQAEILNASLAKTLDNLAAWREASLKLQEGQAKVLDNNGKEQSAVVSLNGEFTNLLAGSQSLAGQSKSNLDSANTVYQTFDAIDNQAKDIQNSGKGLVKQAGDLSNNLTNKVAQDHKFAGNFANVLANSRIGNRPNENLLHFLSNPVQTNNAGVIPAGDAFTPYFVVIICFIVALFTAYVISMNERKRLQKGNFEEHRSLIGNNTPITIITASTGIVEGIIIGFLSGYLLQVTQDKFLLWTGLITLISLTMLLFSAYLLRQLKMLGMFILLVILSLYLFLTAALGIHFDKISLAGKIRDFSPLQYIEKLLTEFGSGAADNKAILISLFVLTVISLAAQLFVINSSASNKEIENEGTSESI